MNHSSTVELDLIFSSSIGNPSIVKDPSEFSLSLGEELKLPHLPKLGTSGQYYPSEAKVVRIQYQSFHRGDFTILCGKRNTLEYIPIPIYTGTLYSGEDVADKLDYSIKSSCLLTEFTIKENIEKILYWVRNVRMHNNSAIFGTVEIKDLTHSLKFHFGHHKVRFHFYQIGHFDDVGIHHDLVPHELVWITTSEKPFIKPLYKDKVFEIEMPVFELNEAGNLAFSHIIWSKDAAFLPEILTEKPL